MQEKIDSAIKNEADELIKENPELSIVRSLQIENNELRGNCFTLYQIMENQKQAILRWEKISKEILLFSQKLVLELAKKNDLQ